MHRARAILCPVSALAAACAGDPGRQTLSELRHVEPDTEEVRVENSLEHAMLGYRKFLEEAPESALTPEAMRRLADLKLEREFGILGSETRAPLPKPEAAVPEPSSPKRARTAAASPDESEAELERRAAAESTLSTDKDFGVELPGGEQSSDHGPLEAIALYDRVLTTYPHYQHNDEVLYQKARALDELGRVDEAVAVIERLTSEYPRSRYLDEVQFRRAEYFFTRRKYLEAEKSYSAIRERGPNSEFYELALYKLGWTFYKQDLLEEALHEYIALLDHKVDTGYDFDHATDEEEERRIADTYRVISLCFSSLGGPSFLSGYFAANGERSYEDRIYSQLGEFYLEKLRYQDAAAAYKAFVGLHPLHRSSPHFSMRVVEIYESGEFPRLVLESKKEFAATYGLKSEYWRHFDIHDSPEVLSYLKANLEDLAGHYHALYQNAALADERPASFEEAVRWYRAYLVSFPSDESTPSVHYRLADLLLENRDFTSAAQEYERTAYEYPEHPQAPAAGYAAIYAHREAEKAARDSERDMAKRAAVASTLRFVDRFSAHEHAAAVLGAAVDDLYAMKDFGTAIATADRLLETYPHADMPIRRAAWGVVANASLDTGDYARAEQAWTQVLGLTPVDDDSRSDVAENLAAAIYKQGEQANTAGDYRTAADHFLRIEQVAPTAKIRAVAEYDAGAALIHLEDWAAAAKVLESFRRSYPDHELQRETAKQMAVVYQQEGDKSRAAQEYERVAADASEPEVRREALLVAGDLYQKAGLSDRALSVYLVYIEEFAEPLEVAVETRFKVAEMQKGNGAVYRDQLSRIVQLDASSGSARTARIRFLAAQSALVLAQDSFRRFDEVALVQPFEESVQEKQRRMQVALDTFGGLVNYEVAEVTAAATFYMAEIYSAFGRALVGSERPAGLGSAELRDYEAALEEEAFPFEEQAIEVHEKNLELISEGIYNAWIGKSLAQLAVLVPGRYAKFEVSSGLIASLESYAYRPPQAGTATPAAPPKANSQFEGRASAAVEPNAGELARPTEAIATEAFPPAAPDPAGSEDALRRPVADTVPKEEPDARAP